VAKPTLQTKMQIYPIQQSTDQVLGLLVQNIFLKVKKKASQTKLGIKDSHYFLIQLENKTRK